MKTLEAWIDISKATWNWPKLKVHPVYKRVSQMSDSMSFFGSRQRLTHSIELGNVVQNIKTLQSSLLRKYM